MNAKKKLATILVATTIAMTTLVSTAFGAKMKPTITSAALLHGNDVHIEGSIKGSANGVTIEIGRGKSMNKKLVVLDAKPKKWEPLFNNRMMYGDVYPYNSKGYTAHVHYNRSGDWNGTTEGTWTSTAKGATSGKISIRFNNSKTYFTVDIKVKNNVATSKKNAKNMYVRAMAFNGKKKGKYSKTKKVTGTGGMGKTSSNPPAQPKATTPTRTSPFQNVHRHEQEQKMVVTVMKSNPSKYKGFYESDVCTLLECKTCGQVLSTTKHPFGTGTKETKYDWFFKGSKYPKLEIMTRICRQCGLKEITTIPYMKVGDVYKALTSEKDILRIPM